MAGYGELPYSYTTFSGDETVQDSESIFKLFGFLVLEESFIELPLDDIFHSISIDLLLAVVFWLNLMIWILFAGEEREIQKNYWKEHSVGLSVEAMMLDSKAADLDKEERPEVYFHLTILKSHYLSLIQMNLSLNMPLVQSIKPIR